MAEQKTEAPMRLSDMMASPSPAPDEPEVMRLSDMQSVQTLVSETDETAYPESPYTDIISSFTPEETAAAEAQGKIGYLEQAQRQDKTEMIPVTGSIEGGVKSVKLMTAVNRYKKDEYASRGDRFKDVDMINRYLWKLNEERVRGYTWGGRITQGVAALPAFMIEFLLAGGAATVGKGLVKEAVKGSAKQIVKSGTKKLATRIVGGVVSSAARTAHPVMWARSVKGYADRQLDATMELTDKGLEIVEKSTEKPYISAVAAIADVWIENFSEGMGADIGRYAKKLLPKGLLPSLLKAYKKMNPNQNVRKFFTKTGFDGFVEEWGEEKMGALLRGVFNLDNITDDEGNRKPMFDRIVESMGQTWEDAAVEAGTLAFPTGVSAISQQAGQRIIDKRRKKKEKDTSKILTDAFVKQISEMTETVKPEGTEGQLKPPTLQEQAEAAYDSAAGPQSEIGKDLDDLQAEMGLKERQLHVQKKIQSIVDKVIRKDRDDYTVASIKDLARGAAILDNDSQRVEADKRLKQKGWTPVEDHGSFMWGGYRVDHYEKTFENGVTGEMQLHTKESWDFKASVSDNIYKEVRDEFFPAFKNRTMTREQWKYFLALDKMGQKGWNAVYAGKSSEEAKAAISWSDKRIAELRSSILTLGLPIAGTQAPSTSAKGSSLPGNMRKSTTTPLGNLKTASDIISSKESVPQQEALVKYLKEIKEKYSKPQTITRKEVKAIQEEVIRQIKASGLTAADKAKFISTIKNIQTMPQLTKAIPIIEQRAAALRTAESKRKLQDKIKKLLSKTKPVKSGDLTKAKYDYESNKVFVKLREYAKMTQKKAQAALDSMPEENLSNMDLIRKRMLSLKANGAQASLAIHQRVHDDIANLKMIGAAAKDNESFDKAVNRRENVDEAITGMNHVKGGEGIIAKIKKAYAKGFGNIDTLYNLVFGKKFADKYNPEINQSERNTATYKKTKEVTDRATEIYGKDMITVFQEMSEHKFDLTDHEGLDHVVTRMQIMDIYNAIKNKNIKKRYYDTFGEVQINGLLWNLNEQDRQVADLLQEAVQSYRGILNDRNIEITGQDLGFVENYWPATSEHQPSVYDDYRTQGETPSALKERAKGKVIPRPADAWHKFQKHVGEGEHVNHLAREHEQLKRMLTDRKVKHQIEKQFGEDVYQMMMDQLDSISLNAQTARIDAVSSAYGKALNNWVKAKLLSPSIYLRQWMSASNYMEHMPVAKWTGGFVKGLLTPKSTFDFMWEGSGGFLEARYHKGYKEALSRALNDAESMSVAQGNWAKGLSALVRSGDISAIIYGGKPYIDHLMSKGMSKKEAFRKFEKETLKSQQSGMSSSLSEFQKNKNAFVRLLLAFKNTPAQYLRKMGDATIAVSNKDISKGQYAKTMAIYGVIQPTLYVTAGAAVKQGLVRAGQMIRGDDPEDIEWEGLWDEIMVQMVVNPVTAIPFLSGGAKYVVRKMMGMKAYNITSLPMISDVETAIRKMTKKEVTFDDWLTIAGTAAEISTATPVLSIKRMYDYLMPQKKKKSKF